MQNTRNNKKQNTTQHKIVGSINGHQNAINWTIKQHQNAPDNTTTTQTGNLFGWGSDHKTNNLNIARTINQQLRNKQNPTKQWTQLVGSTELSILKHSTTQMRNIHKKGVGYSLGEMVGQSFDLETVSIVVGWFNDRLIQVADAYNNVLVVSGGLSSSLWVALGRPKLAKDTATLLNLMLDHKNVAASVNRVEGGGVDVFEEGSTRLGGVAHRMVDDVFIERWRAAGGMPFSQVTGSKPIFRWDKGVWAQTAGNTVKDCSLVLGERNHVVSVVNGGFGVRCIDWGLQDYCAPSWVLASWGLFDLVSDDVVPLSAIRLEAGLT